MITRTFTFSLLLILFLNPSYLIAQGEKERLLRHEVYLSRGAVSTPKLSLLVNDLFTFVGNAFNWGGDDVIDTEITSTNVIRLGYNYRLNKERHLGVAFSFEQLSVREAYRSGNARQQLYNVYTLMAHTQRAWVNMPDRSIYYGFSVGISFKEYRISNDPSQYNNYTTFAYQITPIGVRLGKK